MASLCSWGVLGTANWACALALLLAFALAFPFAVAVVPVWAMAPTKDSKLGPPLGALAAESDPLVKASWPAPSPVEDNIAVIESTVDATATSASWDTATFSRSVNLECVWAQNLVDSGSVGQSGSGMPPFRTSASIFCLGSQTDKGSQVNRGRGDQVGVWHDGIWLKIPLY